MIVFREFVERGRGRRKLERGDAVEILWCGLCERGESPGPRGLSSYDWGTALRKIWDHLDQMGRNFKKIHLIFGPTTTAFVSVLFEGSPPEDTRPSRGTFANTTSPNSTTGQDCGAFRRHGRRFGIIDRSSGDYNSEKEVLLKFWQGRACRLSQR